MNSLFANRIGGVKFGQKQEIYKFEKIRLAKERARAKFPDRELLDFGIGEPDAMADIRVRETLNQAAKKFENRGYPDSGGPLFKEAVASYMKAVFGVELDPVHEVCHSIGAKAALSILPAAFINPGDVVLMTSPGYPDFGIHAEYYGGEIFRLPLTPENHFLPDLESIPHEVLQRTKVLVLNYPNNPTGAVATVEFFAKVVDWAKRTGIFVVHDAAYAALVYGDRKPLSLLSLPGAKEVCLEIHTLSKAFNMVGWRLGWVCGAEALVRAYTHVKDRTDCGQFLAIQEAGALALSLPEITEATGIKYARRLKKLKALLVDFGFKVFGEEAGFFLYTQAPVSLQQQFDSAESLSTWIVEELGIVTVPWDEAGPFLRFSVTFQASDSAKEQAIFNELRKRLSTEGLLSK